MVTSQRENLFKRFQELGIETTTKAHDPVYTVEQAKALRGEISGAHCKNLFLKDKKGQCWLVVCLEDAEIDLKSLPKTIGSARISFGKPDLLMEKLCVEPGSVTPFAAINDADNDVSVVLDSRMMANDVLNFHPLENNATTSIASRDLLTFLKSCGKTPQISQVDLVCD